MIVVWCYGQQWVVSWEVHAPKVLQAVHEGGLRLGSFVSQSPSCVLILCSDQSSMHSPPSPTCTCLCSLQNGQTPVLLAFIQGHSHLVDVLVRQYGCSMSEEEVSAVC